MFMKSIAIPFICVILVFSLWWLSILYTADTEKDLLSVLSETHVAASVEDWEGTAMSYRKFIGLWQKYSTIYSYYMNSADIDEIELAIKKCEGYIAAKNKGLACGEISEIMARLQQIHEGSLFSAKNIL